MPLKAKHLHRPLSGQDNPDEALTWREMRTVTANPTLHYDRMMLLLGPMPHAPGLARQQVPEPGVRTTAGIHIPL